MDKGKVSIIVPAYNVRDYIGKCIDSIIVQNYKNLQIILVDDGSTDDTYSILQEYNDSDDRIILIHQNNKGLSGARNSGLDIASGEYIYFVDGDDMIHPSCIDTMVSVIEQYHCDIVQCSVHSFLDEKSVPSKLAEENIEILLGKEICRRMILSNDSSEMTVAWRRGLLFQTERRCQSKLLIPEIL